MVGTLVAEVIAHLTHIHDAQSSGLPIFNGHIQIGFWCCQRVEWLTVVGDGYAQQTIADVSTQGHFRRTAVVDDVAYGLFHRQS